MTPPNSQDVQTLFNDIAPIYDQMNDWLSFGIHRVWKLMTVKWSNPQPYNTALDLCCGTGDLTFLMAKQLVKGKVIGVDFSSQLLAKAQKKQPFKSLNSEIQWLEADVLSLPFDNNYFDCATMGYGLRNVTNISACLQEIQRVLKPNSKVAILDFHKPSDNWVANGQKWYLDKIVVTIADLLGTPSEYAYIYPSLERFPNGETQIQLGLNAGFSQGIHYPLFGGIMGVLVLTK
ncbi:bifunctional demethylmenaquinone methyltransferase/2-methoxy-6-polyprenyl-1,4-benzoquinol methylase UbiE [Geminocystis sp. GBBB08]|uniref:bifunctional demethylmenaquinone methyltransferase/2-methoxy-6-polyprenyl-1,4-benzoquinol methylase UbiE n=1 Tax=Geminocystis sp. GBBB08 TaxID=2604140 RepID=UPI0027E36901|nr:bifunctional demethylmenaquinone methyltransferase/2-methoxy-6-polyprenyl-1,4-benzoquinol methylase UbiE [Geminocystis sp. GBBB08]MBL1210238.1 bifunctional demethylmenaquinone methyltransferase/2-methoxy-6-polyprenyl-1,4-benzoquinol methylase UbiE [Geminocystis sp. GBBB08]